MRREQGGGGRGREAHKVQHASPRWSCVRGGSRALGAASAVDDQLPLIIWTETQGEMTSDTCQPLPLLVRLSHVADGLRFGKEGPRSEAGKRSGFICKGVSKECLTGAICCPNDIANVRQRADELNIPLI